MNDLMTSKQLAEHLHLKEYTIREWRMKNTGPQWFRLGTKAIRYRRTDVETWINQQISNTQKEAS